MGSKVQVFLPLSVKSLTASHALQVFQAVFSDMRFLAQRREQESCQQSAVRGPHGHSGLCQALSCALSRAAPQPSAVGDAAWQELQGEPDLLCRVSQLSAPSGCGDQGGRNRQSALAAFRPLPQSFTMHTVSLEPWRGGDSSVLSCPCQSRLAREDLTRPYTA